MNNTSIKVITWRLLSIACYIVAARLWFGDWHVTGFGLVMAAIMTYVHYLFEKVWDKHVVEELYLDGRSISP